MLKRMEDAVEQICGAGPVHEDDNGGEGEDRVDEEEHVEKGVFVRERDLEVGL